MKKDVFIRQSIEKPSRKIRKDHHKGPPEVINQHLGNQRTVTKKRMVPVEKSYKEGEGGGGGGGGGGGKNQRIQPPFETGKC